MELPMNISPRGIDFIAQQEGCRLTAYRCPAGVLTIGYGHTQGVRENQTITLEMAKELLKADLGKFVAGVNDLVLIDLTQGEFDALVSLTFNIGLGAFKKSTLLKKLNNEDIIGAADEFLRWNRGGGKVLPGLTLRRKQERLMFLEG